MFFWIQQWQPKSCVMCQDEGSTSHPLPFPRFSQHAFYTSGDLVDELYLNMDPCLMGEDTDSSWDGYCVAISV